jgi:hypothetical protein
MPVNGAAPGGLSALDRKLELTSLFEVLIQTPPQQHIRRWIRALKRLAAFLRTHASRCAYHITASALA